MPPLHQCLFSLFPSIASSQRGLAGPCGTQCRPRAWVKFYCSKMCNIVYFCWELGNAFLLCIFYFVSFELKHNNNVPLPLWKARLHLSKCVDSSVLLCPNVRWSLVTGGGVHCLFWKVISSETASSYSFKIWSSVLCTAEISI